jgi:phosphate-selective porin OprO and OprP
MNDPTPAPQPAAGCFPSQALPRRAVTFRGCSVLLGLWFLATFPSAQCAEPVNGGASIEERLQRLERELETVREENRALRQEMGVTNAVFVRSIGPVNELKIGGLVQAQADFGDKGDVRWATAHDRFYMRRVRLNTLGRFAEHFDFRAEVELAGSMGEAPGMRVQLTDGWVNWNRYDFARVKAGQFFPAFGFEKRQPPATLQSIEFSLAGDQMLPDRQVGTQIWGDALEKRMSWSFGVFNGMNANSSFNDSDNFMVVPRLEGKPFKGRLLGLDGQWAVGLSAYYSDNERFPLPTGLVTPGQTNVFAGQRLGTAVDTQLKLGPVDVWAEYFRTEFDPDIGSSHDAEGWYVLGGYYVVPRKLQALVKYEAFDPDTGVSGDSTDTWTFGLSYAFKGYNLKLFANYLLFDLPGEEGLQQKFITRLQAAF